MITTIQYRPIRWENENISSVLTVMFFVFIITLLCQKTWAFLFLRCLCLCMVHYSIENNEDKVARGVRMVGYMELEIGQLISSVEDM
jgi:hypothetical protein